MKRRILSLLMACILCLSVCAVPAAAAADPTTMEAHFELVNASGAPLTAGKKYTTGNTFYLKLVLSRSDGSTDGYTLRGFQDWITYNSALLTYVGTAGTTATGFNVSPATVFHNSTKKVVISYVDMSGKGTARAAKLDVAILQFKAKTACTGATVSHAVDYLMAVTGTATAEVTGTPFTGIDIADPQPVHGTFALEKGSATAATWPKTNDVYPGGTIKLPTAAELGLVKEGYTLKAWKLVVDESHASDTLESHTEGSDAYEAHQYYEQYVNAEFNPGSTFTLNGNIGIYGVWEKMPTYSVTYAGNGGSGIAPTSVARYSGEVFSLAAGDTLSRTGHRFLGWSTAAESSANLLDAGYRYTMGSEPVTFFAQWMKTYAVSHNVSTGSNLRIITAAGSSTTVDEGGSYRFTVDVSALTSGYTFSSVYYTVGTDAKQNVLTPDTNKVYTVPDIRGDIAVYAVATAPGGGGGFVPPVGPTEYEHLCVKYTDIAGHWGHQYICYMVENKLMNGTAPTVFAPNAPMSRAMIATVIWRIEGSQSAGKSSFTDLSADWYHTAVDWCAEKGIVKGYSTASFGPNDNVTREQIAAILFRYAQYKGYNTTDTTGLSAFTDKKAITPYALPALSWANARGIVMGRTVSTLVPQGDATRAEMATMFTRFLEETATNWTSVIEFANTLS